MNSAKDDLKLPTPTAADRARDLVLSGVSDALPVGGSTAAQVLGWVIKSPLERRVNAWREQLGELVLRLRDERGIPLEELRDNPVFIDVVLTASQTAARTSSEEKLTYLRNAIWNAAAPEPPGPALQQLFLTLVDELTVWHLKALQMFEDTAAWAGSNQRSWPSGMRAGPSTVLQHAFPELREQPALADAIWRGLYQRTLVDSEQAFFEARGPKGHTSLAGPGISDLGKQLLAFIREST